MPGSNPPGPALLVCGLIAGSTGLLDDATNRLVTGRAGPDPPFGPIAVASETVPFDWTDYYRRELGERLLRRWVGFKRLVEPDRLASIKRATGRIEAALAEADRRRVNIDPGLLSLHSLVLASTKQFAHRVYLADGVYAEPTLLYESGGFRGLPWTYPDYRSPVCHEFLARCRALLRQARSAG